MTYFPLGAKPYEGSKHHNILVVVYSLFGFSWYIVFFRFLLKKSYQVYINDVYHRHTVLKMTRVLEIVGVLEIVRVLDIGEVSASYLFAR